MSKPSGTLVYTHELPVRWCDMDAFGHVNNSVYFSYFEQARISWLSSVIAEENPFDEQTAPVIVTANCTFRKPILYPETLAITILTGPPGRASFDCFHQIFSKKNPDVLYAEGAVKVVWVSRETGRSVALPDYIRNFLLQLS